MATKKPTTGPKGNPSGANSFDGVPTPKKAAATGAKKNAKGAVKAPLPSPAVVASSLAQRKLQAERIVPELARLYPEALCALTHASPFQLLIATILSAQCTDERVNMVTPGLFAKWPTAEAMAKAPLPALEETIRSTGFFHNKAKNIKGCCEKLVRLHGGEVPAKLEELVQLPGVGRKTANVVLGTAMGIASGVVVDTHVGRLSKRLGLTKQTDAVKIEEDLMDLLPQEEWILFSHRMIHHGRQVCDARKPACERCTLLQICPRRGV